MNLTLFIKRNYKGEFMQNPTVLIVEDEADLADVITYNLHKENISALHVSYGVNALKNLDPIY